MERGLAQRDLPRRHRRSSNLRRMISVGGGAAGGIRPQAKRWQNYDELEAQAGELHRPGQAAGSVVAERSASAWGVPASERLAQGPLAPENPSPPAAALGGWPGLGLWGCWGRALGP